MVPMQGWHPLPMTVTAIATLRMPAMQRQCRPGPSERFPPAGHRHEDGCCVSPAKAMTTVPERRMAEPFN